MAESDGKVGSDLVLRVGAEELVVRHRYEAASIANDILIAIWFIAGSVLFFSSLWEDVGIWCFLAGSVELLVRPLIRLARLVHVRRMRKRTRGSGTGRTTPHETPLDF
ncbi:YrhK family protein [Streptomonospora wellingtoniae]|uniref:YrhK family protein n=1 Tax=Streptomonospora wellingtoniae TaxID=3075544 RepID=A0ABU2KR89_9ACTN|nr:YrhK family protein [Streptomonospora sp. DSM 45055]MDT0301801.1 YrhK family protein [Streptomonospora sp. DSM 45055]